MTQTEAIEVLKHLADNYLNRQIPVSALGDDVKAQYFTALYVLKTGNYSERKTEDGERSN